MMMFSELHGIVMAITDNRAGRKDNAALTAKNRLKKRWR